MLDDIDAAWEGWLRPLLLLALAGLLVGLWWFGIVGDLTAGVALMAGAVLAGGAVALGRCFEAGWRGWRRGAALLLVLAIGAVAAIVPWRLLGPGSVLFAGEIKGADTTVALPAVDPGIGPVVLYVHGEPAAPARSAPISLALQPGEGRGPPGVVGGEPPYSVVRTDELTSKRRMGLRREATGTDKHDIVWTLAAPPGADAGLSIRPTGKNDLAWPVQVQLRRGRGTPTLLLATGIPLLLIGVLIDGTRRAPSPGRLGVLAGAALASGLLFPQLFAPARVTLSVFGTIVLSMIAGGVPAMALSTLVAARFRRKGKEAGDPSRG